MVIPASRHSGTRRTILTSVAVGTLVLAAAPAMQVWAAPQDSVTICHRTNATNHPYVRITVSRSAADGLGGKGDHYAQHTGPVWTPGQPKGARWGDIIPPIAGVHDGRNWTADGQALWTARCEPTVADRDSDRDGILDVDEDGRDSDGDGSPDVTDVDDDNDGTSDLTDPTSDTDGDGTSDGADGDDDGDGIRDTRDRDDDGDGIPDVTDPDEDPDGDGIPNATDPDNDNDGSLDRVDPDLDNDGIPNSTDSDDDGDGFSDANDPDRLNDGVRDDRRNPDSDADGRRDVTDRDDDNDGTPDVRDGDRNGDGITEEDRQRPGTDLRDIVIVRGSTLLVPRASRMTDAGMLIRLTVACSPLLRSRMGHPSGDLAGGDLCQTRDTRRGLVVRPVHGLPVMVILRERAAEVGDLEPLHVNTRIQMPE